MDLRWQLRQWLVRATSRCMKAGRMFNGYFGAWRGHFAEYERRGLHVLPVHFYSPVPDTRSLPPALWNDRTETVGIDWQEAEALELLKTIAASYREEYAAFPQQPTPGEDFHLSNDAFSTCDAEMLYGMIRHLRPRRMVEIGSGFSTRISARALLRNAADDPARTCEFTAIEPYPSDALRQGLPGLTRLIDRPVQEVPLSCFTELDEGDVLFIDSSHVLRIGSDVHHEYLHILPRLRPGVFVHIHDVFLPAEYPREWIYERCFFWNEQYLLHAFLMFNNQFRVIWPGHHLHREAPEALREAFPAYDPALSGASSFWMQRVG